MIAALALALVCVADGRAVATFSLEPAGEVRINTCGGAPVMPVCRSSAPFPDSDVARAAGAFRRACAALGGETAEQVKMRWR